MKSMSWSISWQFLQRVFFIVGLATMPVMTGKFIFPIAGNHIGLLFFTAGILIWGIEMYCTRKSLTAGEKRGFLFFRAHVSMGANLYGGGSLILSVFLPI